VDGTRWRRGNLRHPLSGASSGCREGEGEPRFLKEDGERFDDSRLSASRASRDDKERVVRRWFDRYLLFWWEAEAEVSQLTAEPAYFCGSEPYMWASLCVIKLFRLYGANCTGVSDSESLWEWAYEYSLYDKMTRLKLNQCSHIWDIWDICMRRYIYIVCTYMYEPYGMDEAVVSCQCDMPRGHENGR
jgi:hypothetical protein